MISAVLTGCWMWLSSKIRHAAKNRWMVERVEDLREGSGFSRVPERLNVIFGVQTTQTRRNPPHAPLSEGSEKESLVQTHATERVGASSLFFLSLLFPPSPPLPTSNSTIRKMSSSPEMKDQKLYKEEKEMNFDVEKHDDEIGMEMAKRLDATGIDSVYERKVSSHLWCSEEQMIQFKACKTGGGVMSGTGLAGELRISPSTSNSTLTLSLFLLQIYIVNRVMNEEIKMGKVSLQQRSWRILHVSDRMEAIRLNWLEREGSTLRKWAGTVPRKDKEVVHRGHLICGEFRWSDKDLERGGCSLSRFLFRYHAVNLQKLERICVITYYC